MITLINNPDSETILRRIKQGKYAKGTTFEYHIGDYADGVNQLPLGKAMYGMKDKLVLCQRRLSDAPRSYSYQGVVK